MTETQRRLLLLAAIVFVLLGRARSAQDPQHLGSALVLFGLAGVAFLLLDRRRPLFSLEIWTERLTAPRARRTALLAGAGLMAALLATRLSEGKPQSADVRPAIFFWLAGIALYTAAWIRPSRPDWQAWVRAHGPELWIVATLTLIALLLRITAVDIWPWAIAGDEGSMGLEALRVIHGELRTPFVTGWLSHPTLYFFLLSVPVRLFGQGILGLRLISVLVGTATVPALYLLGRKLYGRAVGLTAATILAVLALHIHFSRLAINNTSDLLMAVVGFALLYGGLRTGRFSRFLLAGLVTGLSLYFYTGARVIPLLMAGFAGLWLARYAEGRERRIAGLLVMGGAFLVVALPLLRYFQTHPNDFMARWNQVGVLPRHWLSQEAARLNKSVASVLAEQLRRAFLGFVALPDNNGFYGARRPYLDSLSASLLILGLIYSAWRAKDPRYALLHLWFWGVIVLGGALTMGPPNAARLLAAVPPACLLIAVALERLVREVATQWRAPAAKWGTIGLVVGLIAWPNVSYYFGTYLPSGRYSDPNTRVGTAVGFYLRSLPQDRPLTVYFYGLPRMFYGFGSIPYLGLGRHGLDMPIGPANDYSQVWPNRDAVFVFLPERAEELAQTRRRWPNGRLVIGSRRGMTQPLFKAYEVSRDQLAGGTTPGAANRQPAEDSPTTPVVLPENRPTQLPVSASALVLGAWLAISGFFLYRRRPLEMTLADVRQWVTFREPKDQRVMDAEQPVFDTAAVSQSADLPPAAPPTPRDWRVYGMLALILLVGAFFRFHGLNWDADQHLHPDERFLTMVETAIRLPHSVGEYFDSAKSPLNPYNNGFGFFVYGTFPIFLVKVIGELVHQTGYGQIHLVGRALSGLFDLATVWLIFLIGRRLYGDRVGLLAAALLSLTVLDIQHSHFLVVDTFANFFVVVCLYFCLNIVERARTRDFVWAGVALGLGVASKISIYPLAGVIALAALLHVLREWESANGRMGESANERISESANHAPRSTLYASRFTHHAPRTTHHASRFTQHALLQRTALLLILAAIVSLITFRIFQPYAFKGPGFFDVRPADQWLANMQEVHALVTGNRDYPPGHQWTNRTPLWFPWKNMVLWGMGLPLGLAAWAGWAFIGWELWRRRRSWLKDMPLVAPVLVPWVWVTVFFLYQGSQWVKSLRYLLPTYPFLALFAAYLLVRISEWGNQRYATRNTHHVSRFTLHAPWIIVLVGTLLWATAFTAIYRRPHSRITASRWMFAHVPVGSTIANEHWDDPLPLRIDGKDPFGNMYKGELLTWYDEDTPEKLNKMVDLLDQADYIVLSSNRLYGSIPRLPMRYPMTTRYYRLLFAEKLGFKHVAEITSYPTIFGIQIPDQSSEEAFTVYDHPKVDIFEKTPDFDREKLRHLLGDGIDWGGILRLWPKQATEAKNALMLLPEDRKVYEQHGTWSLLFNRNGLANRLPVIAWWLALELLGLLALPLTFVIFRRFDDRGYVLSKPLGLLIVGWGAWLLASGRLLPFGPGSIAVAAGLLALLAGLLARSYRQELIAFWRARRRIILTEEALFWGFFLVFLLIRWGNPDLWHPVMGGEKPMDFAYLNAVSKSVYFPPYDPWFAGGFINYYYFGFVLAATLIRLTGVIPATAYNLLVPTFFAMTAMGAFVVVYNLLESTNGRISESANEGMGEWANQSKIQNPKSKIRIAFLAALFVAVIGNLGEARLIIEGLAQLSHVQFATSIPGLLPLVKSLDGLRVLIFEHKSLPFRIEWWYWNATRVIPHPPTEAGPITELPFFTFLYADLHAHMMALPYTLLSLAMIVNVVKGGWMNEGHRVNIPRLPFDIPHSTFIILPLALSLGVLWPTNTWDFPTYLLLAGVALLLVEVSRRGWLNAEAWGWAIGRALLVAVLAYAFFFPFHANYARAYSSIRLWDGSRTPLDAYLTIHGFFLFCIVSGLTFDFWCGRNHNAVTRVVRLALRRWYRFGRLNALHKRLLKPGPLYILGLYGVLGGGLAVIVLAITGKGVFALGVALIVWTLMLLFRRRPEPLYQFVLAMFALGLVLTLAVEIVVLKGDIGRMNTVFKFYLQVWVMWAVASAVFLWRMGEWATRNTQHAIRNTQHAPRPTSFLPRPIYPVFVLLFAATLVYPVFATRAKINDRFDRDVGPTLNGELYMDYAIYNDQSQPIPLRWDYEAIHWLEDHVPGTPTIVEANTPLYRWGSRISIYTGLPDVIGWDWHQKQQRAALRTDVVDRRVRDVKAFFTTTDPNQAAQFLRRYGVKYIYVGQLERLYYPGPGLDKFEQQRGRLWDLVYENKEVRIYRVIEEGLG
jgi:YYY domain-containing protein